MKRGRGYEPIVTASRQKCERADRKNFELNSFGKSERFHSPVGNKRKIAFGEARPPQKKARRGKFPRRAWIDLTLLEFKVQIRLEYLILVGRIDAYVARSPCAVGAVDTPGIRPGDVEEYCISQHVSACQDKALMVQLAVEQV